MFIEGTISFSLNFTENTAIQKKCEFEKQTNKEPLPLRSLCPRHHQRSDNPFFFVNCLYVYACTCVHLYTYVNKTKFPRERGNREDSGEFKCFCPCLAIKDVIMQGLEGRDVVAETENND